MIQQSIAQEGNSIKIIHTYLWNGIWVFDEPSVGLDKEAFVAGADTLIDKMVGDKDRITILFSINKFPGSQIFIELVNTSEFGSDYYCPEFDHDLWLCPALFKYFPKAPERVYVQFK